MVLSCACLNMLLATVVEGINGSLLWCSGLMLNLGSWITSGGVGEGVRLGVAAVGKFSRCRS